MNVLYWKCSRSPVRDGECEKRITSLPFSKAIEMSPYQASRYAPAYFASGSDGRDAVSRDAAPACSCAPTIESWRTLRARYTANQSVGAAPVKLSSRRHVIA